MKLLDLLVFLLLVSLACKSYSEHQDAKAGSAFPWILAYVPMRSCHRVLRGTYGEFSPPEYRSDSPFNLWCNWTIWAGSRKHIIIYIQGFITQEDCNRNKDKILFEGVSSLVENDVVYACWKKEMQVFATFAQAVHVVLLKRYLPNCRDTQFKGKYYIFQHQEHESPSRGALIPETLAPKPSKQDNVFQPGWTDYLGGSATLMPMGSPVKLVPYQGASPQLLGMPAACMQGSETQTGPRFCQEEEGIAGGAQWLSCTTSRCVAPGLGYTREFSSMPLETTLFGALQVVEPSLQPTGMSWESRQSVLHPTLRLEDLGDLQFTIKPTRTIHMDLGADLQASSPGRSIGTIGCIGTTVSQGLGLRKDRNRAQLSTPADGAAGSGAVGFAGGLMPSLSSPYDVVSEDCSQLLPERDQSSFGALPVTRARLERMNLQHMEFMDIFPLESSRGGVEKKVVPCPTLPWDILLEHPHSCDQSHPVLQAVPVHPGSPPTSTQACSCPSAEETPASSWDTQSCCYQGDAASQTWLVASPRPTDPELASTSRLEIIPAPVFSLSDLIPMGFGSANIAPKGLFPSGEQPMSRTVPSPLAALGLDPVSLRRRAGVSPGGQEMASPLSPHHPLAAPKMGVDVSPGYLGPWVREDVLEEGSQQRETPAPVSSPSPDSVPRPRVGPPRAKDPLSHGVAPALLQPGMATSGKMISALLSGAVKMQKTMESLQVGVGEQRNSSLYAAHSDPPAVQWEQIVPRGQKLREAAKGPASRRTETLGGQPQKHTELGLPWVMEYFPVRSCHVIFQDGFGVFYLPLYGDIQANIWCNWTIWAGPQKHIVIYVQGFQSNEGCGKNQDKIIFQGVLSRVETKLVYACHNQGTLIFASQATAVHVLLLSRSGPLSSKYKHFEGQYYVFGDYEAVSASGGAVAPQEPLQETSKGESWRAGITPGLLPMLRASLSPSTSSTAGKIQAEVASSENKGQHPPDLVEDAWLGADLGEHSQLQSETEMERSLTYGDTKGREPTKDVLEAPSGGGAGPEAELPALEVAEGDVELVPAPVSTASPYSADVPASEVMSQDDKGVPAGDVLLPGEGHEDLFDLASVLASLENRTALQSLHQPGDVLFEVMTEIKHEDWITPAGSELRRDLLESIRSHIQQNLKLSANRVSEIKLKEAKRTSNASLLLTFWLHLKPEERNMSLLLRSQLGELLGASVGAGKLQLVSLLVEDVNECSSGVNLCGEEAECFNGVGTYLCRCKKGYEDHSPTKSGTLCVRTPQSGLGFLLRHADILVGAAITGSLALLVAAGALCWAKWRRRHPGRALGPEEPPEQAAEEPPVIELRDLGDCLRLDPFQLKLRARPPEWLWGARAHHGQTYRVFLEQSPPL
ncbi:uncharacterized protein LOC116232600 isoform X2 [Phasianus colchicus]|uniref:uncharacterized protein LOC116232600 isoform X2 n=1 Tax=Phasianus colchicus TaxID=9054 RepID=UPI00129D25BC|nr:uncharacterized protein LOC116232600 isoform X2 [Phasianus colchicus]